jgi:predicted metal-dependent enzyme (double-stranded beta helix superfamily)
MFDLDTFKNECRTAVAGPDAQQEIHRLLARALEDPVALTREIGEPAKGEMQTLHRSDDLTILNVVWGPTMTLMPHNHNMWGLIGIYTGREDNIFWKRVPGDPDGRIEAARAKALREREVLRMGPDIIHSVTNPLRRLTGSLHIYGGNFFETPRSEWDPELLVEGPLDLERVKQLFADSNRLLAPPA